MIALYTKPTCSFCVAAKNRLTEWGHEYTEIDVSADEAGLHFLKEQGHRTVPQIYITESEFVPDGASGLAVLGRDRFQTLLERAGE